MNIYFLIKKCSSFLKKYSLQKCLFSVIATNWCWRKPWRTLQQLPALNFEREKNICRPFPFDIVSDVYWRSLNVNQSCCLDLNDLMFALSRSVEWQVTSRFTCLFCCTLHMQFSLVHVHLVKFQDPHWLNLTNVHLPSVSVKSVCFFSLKPTLVCCLRVSWLSLQEYLPCVLSK